jgi:hypothetical protein
VFIWGSVTWWCGVYLEICNVVVCGVYLGISNVVVWCLFVDL